MNTNAINKREQKLVRQAKREVIVNIVSGVMLIGTFLTGFGYMMIR